jgi:hypothetical protein
VMTVRMWADGKLFVPASIFLQVVDILDEGTGPTKVG